VKEYKAECLAMLAQSSRKKREQILNARALAGWELVSVSGGWAYYERERKEVGPTQVMVREKSS